jgi:hypothetical protein
MGVLHDGTEAFLALAQGFFRPLAFGDVAAYADQPYDFLVTII